MIIGCVSLRLSKDRCPSQRDLRVSRSHETFCQLHNRREARARIERDAGRIVRERGEKTRVIATGGMAEVVARHTNIISEVNLHLSLLGLRKFYLSSQKE